MQKLYHGVQEVSGGDLLRHVTGKRVRDGDDFGAGGSGEDGGVSKVKTETPSKSRGKLHVGPTDDNYGDGVNDSSSDNEALKLVRDDSSDSNSSIGGTEGRRKPPRRRRKAKKSKPVVKEERVEAEVPKKPEGSVDMSKFTSVSSNIFRTPGMHDVACRANIGGLDPVLACVWLLPWKRVHLVLTFIGGRAVRNANEGHCLLPSINAFLFPFILTVSPIHPGLFRFAATRNHRCA